MSLKDKKHEVIGTLSNEVRFIDESLKATEERIHQLMKEVDRYKQKRQSTLALLNEIRKIKE